MSNGALVMEGSLGGGMSLDEVLAAVGISRQWLEVVLHDERSPQGSILCKSGRVITAFAEPDRTGVDAFVWLYRRPIRAFAVYRRQGPPERVEPLGALAGLIARARATSAPPEVLLVGAFAETPATEVLDVLSLTRQRVEIEFRDEHGFRGAVLVKAGRVLEARSARSGASGAVAFAELVREPGRTFSVVRRSEGRDGDPIGCIAELVDAAETAPTPILQGRFGETRIAGLLDSVRQSRPLLEIRLWREGEPLGRVLLERGQLLDVRHGELVGRPAFRAILADPGTRYRVARHPRAVRAEPLGRLVDWLTDAPSALPVAVGAPLAEEAPTTLGPGESGWVRAEEGSRPAALDARLGELSAAIVAVERAVAASNGPAHPDRVWLTGLAVCQVLTLVLLGALLVQSLLGT